MTVVTLPPGRELFTDDEPLVLQHGDHEKSGRYETCVPYELVGAPDAPVIVVQGGISADAHVAASKNNPAPGWWDSIVGPRGVIDTDRFRVLSLDYLGGENAPTDAVVSPLDQSRLTARLLTTLGIDQLHAFVGASYGGAVGLSLAQYRPDLIERLIVIGAAHQPNARAVGWRHLQRAVIDLGRELPGDAEKRAISIARGIGMLAYRSPAELDRRFAHGAGLSDYLAARGRDFADRFSSASYRTLSAAIDLVAVDPAQVASRTTVVASTTDELVPFETCRQLATQLPNGAFVALPSIFGHDAFLKEIALVSRALRAALREEVAR